MWLIVAVVLGAALLAAGYRQSPLNDRDPVRQRADFLDSVGPRSAAPEVTGLLPARGRITVVFFVRDAQQAPLRSALRKPGALPRDVDAAILGGQPIIADDPVPLVTDGEAVLARRFAMPVPRDGGYPVGYAICGPDGTVRYRTLDPGVVGRLQDVRTMLRALR